MRPVRRHAYTLAFALVGVTLLLTFGAGTLSGFRLHHAAAAERQTIRTQRLEVAVLQHSRSAAHAAFDAVAAHGAAEGRRLRPGYDTFLASPARSGELARMTGLELARQSRTIHAINHGARRALIALAVCAALLVLSLLWLFELERRSGRIDRDNAARSAELIRLRDEFVAVVSHELRTPLTSIIGYLELLVDEAGDALTQEQRTYLDIVQRSTSRLVELVSELLLVAEAERGPLPLELAEIDIATLTANAVQAARPAADTREVVLALVHRSPGAITGDPTRLAQVLDNLISNAIKFTPKGGRVTVRVTRPHGEVVLEVADTGGGIAEIDRQRLFDPFFRSRQATAGAVPGTGLGLTITKAIVDAHRGTIEVDDTPGGGATFRVRLPAYTAGWQTGQ